MQGITFFKEQHHFVRNGKNKGQPVRPLYHRDDSCGLKGVKPEIMDKRFDCNTAVDGDDKARRTKYIITCYIERLVFNELFERKFGIIRTDIDHLLHMHHKLDNYLMSCIDYNVRVKITFSRITKKPKKLEVRYYDVGVRLRNSPFVDNASLIGMKVLREREIYEKISEFEVQCKKYVYNERGRVIQRFSKKQSFEKESPWQEP